jgi:hypothetical protein
MRDYLETDVVAKAEPDLRTPSILKSMATISADLAEATARFHDARDHYQDMLRRFNELLTEYNKTREVENL